MMKFLIGPALVGAGYAAGSYYGADVEQNVHKSPEATYAAIKQAFESMQTSGMTSFEGGTPIPYKIAIDRTPGAKLVATLFFGGKEGGQAELRFVGQNDGRDTRIEAQIHADRTVLGSALAGTDRARLAFAPDWMLNLAFKPLLKELARKIERGELAQVRKVSEGDAEARWEARLTREQQNGLAQWRQYEATRPSMDPDSVARNASWDGN